MELVKPKKIAAIMSLIPIPHSFAELGKLVSQGLPKQALRTSVQNGFQ